MTSPRGLVPEQLTVDKLFEPIAAGFSKYSTNQFEFILGAAESLDTEAKMVEISTFAGKRTLEYDFLVLATGSHSKAGTPFKGPGSTEATKKALVDFQTRVRKAETIVVAGAGLTGAETAGELGFEYGKRKEVTLVSLA